MMMFGWLRFLKLAEDRKMTDNRFLKLERLLLAAAAAGKSRILIMTDEADILFFPLLLETAIVLNWKLNMMK